MTAHRPPPPDPTAGGSRAGPHDVDVDTHGRSGERTVLAFGLCTVALIAVGVAVVGSAVAGTGIGGAVDAFVVTNSVMGLAFPLCGVLLAWQRPRNPIGWLLLADGIGHAITAAMSPLLALGRDAGWPRAVLRTIATLYTYSWPWSIALFLPLALLLFPTGRPLSPRWRPWLWITAATGLLFVVAEGARPDDGLGGVEQWLVLTNYDDLAPLWTASELIRVVITASALLALVLRYRRGDDRLRRQLRWLALAIALVVAVLVVWGVFASGTPLILLAIPLVPVAITVAILRHQLLDIDLVISRSLVFGGLAAFITGVYALVVVGLGSLIGAGSGLALSVGATALVAVAFEPLRTRLQRLANRVVHGRRASPAEVLTELTAGLAVTEGDEQAPARLARLLAAGTGATAATVWLRIDDELRAQGTAAPPVPARDEELPPLDVGYAVPLRDSDGRLLGALSITKSRGDAVTPVDRRLLEDVAGGAALLLRNLRLQSELREHAEALRESRARLVATQDAERRRLERDLHDGAQQRLVALSLKLGLAATLARREGADDVTSGLAEVGEQARGAVEAVRSIARGIFPPLLEAEGLAAAVAGTARLAPVPVAVRADWLDRYPRAVESTVYFCVVEAIGNAVEHAHPGGVEVTITATDGELAFTVADDGAGFDPAAPTAGTGLAHVADRLDVLGGALVVDSTVGTGTTVTGRLPVDPSPQPTAARTPTTAGALP